jgi:hypothetical protein
MATIRELALRLDRAYSKIPLDLHKIIASYALTNRIQWEEMTPETTKACNCQNHLTDDPSIADSMRVMRCEKVQMQMQMQPIWLFGKDRLMDLPFFHWTILIKNPNYSIVTFGFTDYSNEEMVTQMPWLTQHGDRISVFRFQTSVRVSFSWDFSSGLVKCECFRIEDQSGKFSVIAVEAARPVTLRQMRPFCIVPASVTLCLLPFERSVDSDAHARWIALNPA